MKRISVPAIVLLAAVMFDAREVEITKNKTTKVAPTNSLIPERERIAKKNEINKDDLSLF